MEVIKEKRRFKALLGARSKKASKSNTKGEYLPHSRLTYNHLTHANGNPLSTYP